jgi:hypothetical protein
MSVSSDHNPSRRLTDILPLRLALWMALAALFLWAGFEKLYYIGHKFDWYFFTHHLEVARRSWAEYGQMPAWNPYLCGGLLEIGNLQASSVAPVNILTALFGTIPGMKLAFWVLFVVSQEGAYRYARHHDIVGLGAVLAAVAFCFSGRYASPIVNGHPVLLGFLLMPWVFLGLEKGLRSWWWAVGGGLVMGSILANGGAVPTPMISVFLAFLTIFLTVRGLVSDEVDYAWYRPALTLAVMALVTSTAWAVRVLPTLESALSTPREWPHVASFSFTEVLEMLFVATDGIPGSYDGTATSYVGFGVLGMALYPLFFGDRRAGRMAFFAVLAMALTMGGASPFEMYEWLKELPVYENLRAPFRYANFAVFFLAMGAGAGLALVESQLASGAERLRGHPVFERLPDWPQLTRAALACLVVAAVGGLGYAVAQPEFEFNKARVDETFTVEWARSYDDRPFRQSIGNRWHAYIWPNISRGSISCWEAQPFEQSAALRADLDQEEFLKEPSAGSVERQYWSPHRIVLEASLKREARLIVNQNHHRGWTSNVGTVTDDEGRLAVDLPEGEHRVVIEFADPMVRAGFGISLVTLVLLGLLAADRRWKLRNRWDGETWWGWWR